MRVPEEKIEEIRSSANIVDLISGYVQLKKRGRNYIGLCPFHTEKTPSFTVSEDKQIYHCFGCHAGGNVYKFLMDYKSLSFIEAVQEVADYIGIPITYEKESAYGKDSEQEVYYDINTVATKYFSDILLNNIEAEPARDYLDRRNIKLPTQKLFGVGYALPDWEKFVNFIANKGIDLRKAKTLGLVDTKDDGGYYDKYRDRIIFPIYSPNGRVIAFGGRVLQDSPNAAKYLNSPESIIYLKRRSLYGLFHSKEEIRKLDRAILVEGYMDLISLFQHGVKNVIASSGTSLTEEQATLLSRYTKNVIVLFDADTAGQKASMRSIEIFLKQDFDVKLVSLPQGEDPDSFIHKFGKVAFDELIAGAKHFLEYQTAQFEAAGKFSDPAQQTDAVRELVKSAALVSDELKRTLLIKSISKKFNLREKLIETELEKYLNQINQSKERVQARTEAEKTENKSDNKRNGNSSNVALEKEIVRLMFTGDIEILDQIFLYVRPEEIGDPVCMKIGTTVYDSYQRAIIAPAALIELFEDEKIKSIVFDMVFSGESISKKWEERTASGVIEKDSFKHAYDTIKKYRIEKVNEHIKRITTDILKTKDEHELFDLMKKNEELNQEKKKILNEKTD
ncbi:MAG: DNA primase [bacterium]